jgi:uncharacterized small protein (DUF1192 family)
MRLIAELQAEVERLRADLDRAGSGTSDQALCRPPQRV